MSSYVVICLHISPFVPIWLRERDLLPFCRWQNVRLRRHGSRRPTVRRTVGTDLSNPSSPPHERKTPPFGGVLFHGCGRGICCIFAVDKNVRLRRRGSRRPTVHRTVGTDLSNPSLIPSHETKTPPFGGAFVSWLRERDLNPRPPGYELL